MLKKIALYIFDIIDHYYHQQRIINFILRKNFSINYFIDVGSHLGTYSDLILKYFKKSKIIMIEPQKEIFKKIKLKYKNNKKILILNHAISDKNVNRNLYINYHDLTSSLTKFNYNNNYLKIKSKIFNTTPHGMIKEKLIIKTIKMSTLLSKENITNVDLIKIDTEGHELEVLKGMGDKIKKIKNILIEFHNDKIFIDYNPKKVHQYLLKNNFILLKKFKFPFTKWEDRFYKQK
jgi:FkbM family methyltransferase